MSGVALPTCGARVCPRTYQAALTDTATLSPNLVNDARFELSGWVADHAVPTGNVCTAGVRFRLLHQRRIALWRSLLNHQYEWADTLNLAAWTPPDQRRIQRYLLLVGRIRTGIRQRLHRWPLPDQLEVRDHSYRHAAYLQSGACSAGLAEGLAADRQQLYAVVWQRKLQHQRHALRHVCAG